MQLFTFGPFSLLFLISCANCVQDVPYSSEFCSNLLTKLSQEINGFIDCSMHNAVPVTFCLSCSTPYDDLMRAYSDINTKVDDKNVSCRGLYFDLDRLGLVERSFTSAVSLWTGGYCDDCYENPLVVSNRTIKFNDLIIEFNQCIARSPKEVVCDSCRKHYDKVNKHYDAIKEHAKGAVCFDLQDKINDTRRFWSDVHCNTNPDEKQITFLILSAAVTSLPICFYVLMFAHTHLSQRNEENMSFLNESSAEPEEEVEGCSTIGPHIPSINLNEPTSSR